MGIGGNGRPTLELLGNVAHAGAEKYPCKKYIRLYDQVVFFYFFFFKSKEKSSIYHTRCNNSTCVSTNLFRCCTYKNICNMRVLLETCDQNFYTM